jgi:hypothetical protein
MRGGSRFGAGCPGWKGKTGHRLQLDVRRIVRDGLLVPGRDYTWSWSSDGRQTASIGMLIDSPNSITLHYSTNEQAVRLPILLNRT